MIDNHYLGAIKQFKSLTSLVSTPRRELFCYDFRALFMLTSYLAKVQTLKDNAISGHEPEREEEEWLSALSQDRQIRYTRGLRLKSRHCKLDRSVGSIFDYLSLYISCL